MTEFSFLGEISLSYTVKLSEISDQGDLTVHGKQQFFFFLMFHSSTFELHQKPIRFVLAHV